MSVIVRAVLLGMLVAMAGTIPRNLLFAANLKFHPELPWAVPFVAVYLWIFWRYLQGAGPPASSAQFRRTSLRAQALPIRVWAWALLAGAMGIVALVIALTLLNQMIALPQQQVSELRALPPVTAITLLLAAAPIAGVVEEAAFRGYMQSPIERKYGLLVAILITGTMFAVAHMDFTLVLWPYYVAVAAIYGTVTYLTKSILPAVVLHTGGNVYSNLDLWFHGQSEWQATTAPAARLWEAGPTLYLWEMVGALLALISIALWAYGRLAIAGRARAENGGLSV
jgi:membrane protease YdiL (CAAX protease family)